MYCGTGRYEACKGCPHTSEGGCKHFEEEE